jgi:exopolyphosphatase/guanosine-5'-triphosphate,3'-diphosphate pyrophosphatase
MRKRSRTLAAIDIGTNSFHLVVADVDPTTGRFKVLDREKELVRLGTGSTDMKFLSSRAINRGLDVLRTFKSIADTSKASVRAIATSAVREALNREEFIRRVRAETGITIEIASGPEEARLIYLGILQALPVFDQKVLLVDIGGGSTEFLLGHRKKVLYSNSLKVGAVRLTERFFANQVIKAKTVKACREFLRGMLTPITREVQRRKWTVAVGSSGTIVNIAGMIALRRDGKIPSGLNATRFTLEELEELTGEILDAPAARQRAKIPGLDPARSDIIVAGALILRQVLSDLEIREMTVSEYALREGIILDAIAHETQQHHLHHLADIRYSSVLHLGQSFRFEQGHARQVTKLALKLFDETVAIHKLGDREREFLEAAALLHEVGLSISHSQHHRHSYYLIRNSELLGFTENEKEIIATTARYHRKSHPKSKHEGFSSLVSEDQVVVRKLSSILRIADGLDRSHAARVKDLSCQLSAATVTLRIKRSDHKPIDLELWSAGRKKDLFEETFNVRVRFSAPE